MEVECHQTAQLNGSDEAPGIKRGKRYPVLQVCYDLAQGICQFRIERDGDRLPELFDARHFRVISDQLPHGWIITQQEDLIILGPVQWARPGYWNKLASGDPRARQDYEKSRPSKPVLSV